MHWIFNVTLENFFVETKSDTKKKKYSDIYLLELSALIDAFFRLPNWLDHKKMHQIAITGLYIILFDFYEKDCLVKQYSFT